VGQGPDLKKLYHAERIALLRSRTVVSFGAATPLYASFWALDWITAPGREWLFLKLRIVTVVIFVASILIARRGSELAVRASSLSAALAATVTVAIMTFYLEGFTTTYFIGLTIPMYVAGLLMPWSALEVAVFLTISVGTYAAGNFALLSNGVGTGKDAVTAMFFVCCSAAFTIVAVAWQARGRFADFSLRMDLERANKELRELDRLKSRFFANVSHELRTPLTLVLSPLEAMIGEGSPPPARRTIETIHANAVRLLKLINTLLDFARVDEGKVKLNVDHHDLVEVVKRIVEMARPFAERRSVRLTCEVGHGLTQTWLDLDLIEKVVYNLLSNALKFTPDDGAVVVRVLSDKERLWCEVEDTGPGIPEEQLGHLFERFQQASSSSRASGSGIGLSLARALVRLHMGDIEARNAPGKGALLRFWLPLDSPLKGQAIDRRRIADRREAARLASIAAEAPVPGAAAEASSRDTPSSEVVLGEGSSKDAPPRDLAPREAAPKEAAARESARLAAERRKPSDRREAGRYELPRFLFEANEYGAAPIAPGAPRAPGAPSEGVVLIAEDHREMREYIRMLVDHRYDVIEAENGRVALSLARTRRPDLVIADIMMPEMDGVELTREIRKDPVLALTPVIVVTARAELSARLSGLQIGANDYLVKPFHPQELVAKVDSFMRLRRYEHELADRTATLEKSLRELTERETRLSAIGRMAGAIVHDLRNPLTTVVGFSELALQTAEQQHHDDIASDLRPVVAEGSRLRDMLEEILSFARGNARELSFVRASVADVLETGTRLLSKDLAKRGIDIVREPIPGDPIYTRIDRETFLRVLENLIRNAAEAIDARGPDAEPRGRVTLSVRRGDEVAEIRVRDNGTGLPDAVRARLFEPFVTSKKVGTGIGLATSRNSIRAQGGDLTAEPNPEGGGASFLITLPLAAERRPVSAG